MCREFTHSHAIVANFSEAAVQRCSQEKVFWKYAANLQENSHAEVRFALQLYWNRTSAWVFSSKSADIFRTPFPRNTSGWLLLNFSNILSRRSEIYLNISKIVFQHIICSKQFLHLQFYSWSRYCSIIDNNV